MIRPVSSTTLYFDFGNMFILRRILNQDACSIYALQQAKRFNSWLNGSLGESRNGGF